MLADLAGRKMFPRGCTFYTVDRWGGLIGKTLDNLAFDIFFKCKELELVSPDSSQYLILLAHNDNRKMAETNITSITD